MRLLRAQRVLRAQRARRAVVRHLVARHLCWRKAGPG